MAALRVAIAQMDTVVGGHQWEHGEDCGMDPEGAVEEPTWFAFRS